MNNHIQNITTSKEGARRNTFINEYSIISKSDFNMAMSNIYTKSTNLNEKILAFPSKLQQTRYLPESELLSKKFSLDTFNNKVNLYTDSFNISDLNLRYIDPSSFSCVQKVENRLSHNSKLIAYQNSIKVALLNPESSPNQIFYSNFLIHKHIPRLLGYTVIKNQQFCVFEEYEYTLNEWLSKNSFTKREILQAFLNLLGALKVIHSRNLIHSHINPNTILIDFNGKVSLSGLDNIVDYDKDERELNQLNYCSPEQLISNKFGPEADIWSLGCVLYFMCTKNNPYNEVNDNIEEFIHQIVLQENRPDCQNIYPEVYELFKGIFELSPDLRIKLEELERNVNFLLNPDKK